MPQDDYWNALINALVEKEQILGNRIERKEAQDHYLSLYFVRAEALKKIEKRKGHDPIEHGRQTTRYAYYTGKRIGLPKKERILIEYAAELHDIGKIDPRIPPDIWDKNGSLTPEERKIIEKHSLYSKEIITGKSDLTATKCNFSYIGDLAFYHHERPDGSGYICRLKSDEIPIGSAIISIIDVYNALTHWRPYKEPWPQEKALEELVRNKGTQFYPDIVDAFIDVIKTGS